MNPTSVGGFYDCTWDRPTRTDDDSGGMAKEDRGRNWLHRTTKWRTHSCFGIFEDPHSVRMPRLCKDESSSGASSSSCMDINHLRFLLECFVLSFGPEGPQLGRNHPDSDPERYASVSSSLDCVSVVEEDSVSWGGSSSFSDVLSYSGGCARHTSRGNLQRPCNYQRASTRMPDDDFPAAPSLEDMFHFPDDVILRELSEMRALLERLLENTDLAQWQNDAELLDILGRLPEHVSTPKEPTPHFPVGSKELEECGICLGVQWLYRRACCDFSACNNCLKEYFASKIQQGMVTIECCNPSCNSFIHRDEIAARLDASMKEIFYKLLLLANEDSHTKTCPRCNHLFNMDQKTANKFGNQQINANRVVCPECDLEWCFSCHAPWHAELTCKQFRKGDRLLKTWARMINHGQLNAQRCPKCKIYIQRTSGCDHMHCTRCKTDFCYRCGDRFRRLKFFGDHYSKLSIFGCKFRYKADKPVQRKAIRGAIFGCKVMVAPVLGTLALCAGAVVMGLGVFALPLYGGLRLYHRYEGRRHAKRSRPAAVVRNNVAEVIWEL